MKANLARFTLALARPAVAIGRGSRNPVAGASRRLGTGRFRLLLVLSALASSALVLEAGRRWL